MASGGSGVCISILQGYLYVCVSLCLPFSGCDCQYSSPAPLAEFSAASGPRHCD